MDKQLLEETRNHLLSLTPQGSPDPEYRKAYVNGVLDFFNEAAKRLEPEPVSA